MSDEFITGCVLVTLLVLLTCCVTLMIRVHRLERRPAITCTHGESSIGPITIQGGRVVGKTTASVSGCRP